MLRPKVLACCVLRYTRRPVMSFDRTADRRAVELADVLDDLGRPDAVTLSDVTNRAAILHLAFADWLRDRRNRRSIPHRFEDCGYVAVSNPNDSAGRSMAPATRFTARRRSRCAIASALLKSSPSSIMRA
jgi:hypothetical protein